jgi:hypothetical protein
MKSPRQFFPPEWIKTAIPAGQATGVPMEIAGVPTIKTVPMPRSGSIVSAGIVLSEPVTAQFIRFAITKNGAETSKTTDMVPGDGSAKIFEVEPGRLVFEKGDRLGINWGSHPGMLPSGVIEALIIFEVQFN